MFQWTHLHQLFQFTHQIFPSFLQLVQPELQLHFPHPKTLKLRTSSSTRPGVLLHVGHGGSVLPQPGDLPHDLCVLHLELVHQPATVLLLLPLRTLTSFSTLLSSALSSSHASQFVFRTGLKAGRAANGIGERQLHDCRVDPIMITMQQNLASLFAYRAMRSCSSFLPPWGSNLPGCARASWDRIPWSGCWRGAAVCGRVRLYCCLQICSRQLDIVHYPFTTQNLLVSPSRKKR